MIYLETRLSGTITVNFAILSKVINSEQIPEIIFWYEIFIQVCSQRDVQLRGRGHSPGLPPAPDLHFLIFLFSRRERNKIRN